MISHEAADVFERLRTGSPALDRILGGGIPARSVIVVAGEPGSGKTIFTLQLLFHHARQGRRCLYFTTLSEPALKLIRYTQLFSFFDQTLVDEQIVFADLGATLRAQGPDQALIEVIERVERLEPSLIAIDSFKAIHGLLGDQARGRAFVYDLAVHMASWGATTLLVGEYPREEIARQPEFAIADGIIRLSNELQELTAVRMMEVLKMRGADYVTGRHFFEIGADGLTFYPRVHMPSESHDGPASPIQRVSTGVTGLDELLRGGLPRASATIMQGGTGIGKTLLGLQFLVHGARQGEPAVFFTLEETLGQLRTTAQTFGWDLSTLEAQGLLVLSHTPPVELSADRFLDEVQRQVASLGARRVVLDSLNSLSVGVPSERRVRELVYALTKHLHALGSTLLMSLEIAELLGAAQLSGHGVSSIADNVLVMRYVEVAGRLERAISVLKARGIAHSTELRHLTISSEGVAVGAPFKEFRGVLTGIPIPMADHPQAD
ncbi:MAG: AAA family ATPase [Ardenticatenaceae bacterium]|nr:AAA family ATPase [Ardenticatenaceae bacterium]